MECTGVSQVTFNFLIPYTFTKLESKSHSMVYWAFNIWLCFSPGNNTLENTVVEKPTLFHWWPTAVLSFTHFPPGKWLIHSLASNFTFWFKNVKVNTYSAYYVLCSKVVSVRQYSREPLLPFRIIWEWIYFIWGGFSSKKPSLVSFENKCTHFSRRWHEGCLK